MDGRPPDPKHFRIVHHLNDRTAPGHRCRLFGPVRRSRVRAVSFNAPFVDAGLGAIDAIGNHECEPPRGKGLDRGIQVASRGRWQRDPLTSSSPLPMPRAGSGPVVGVRVRPIGTVGRHGTIGFEQIVSRPHSAIPPRRPGLRAGGAATARHAADPAGSVEHHRTAAARRAARDPGIQRSRRTNPTRACDRRRRPLDASATPPKSLSTPSRRVPGLPPPAGGARLVRAWCSLPSAERRRRADGIVSESVRPAAEPATGA